VAAFSDQPYQCKSVVVLVFNFGNYPILAILAIFLSSTTSADTPASSIQHTIMSHFEELES
jgi:hypothetical protein